MKNNEFNTNNFERSHYIKNDEMKGAAEMKNNEFNTNGRHFSEEEINCEGYTDTRNTQRFINISSGNTGYERNAGILKAQNYDDYNDNFASFSEEANHTAKNSELSDGVQYYTHNDDQNKKPAPKKNGVKSRVVAIVLASIATAAAITAGFVAFNSISTVNKAKTEASDSVKAANTAKLQADKAIETANKLKAEKEASDKKLAAEQKAAEQKAAEQKAAEEKKAEQARKAEEAQIEDNKKAIEEQKAELAKQKAKLEEEQKKIDQEKQEAEQKKADENKNADNAKQNADSLINTNVTQ